MWLTPDGFCSSLIHFLRLPDTLGHKEPIDLLPLVSFKQSVMETLRVTMHSGAVGKSTTINSQCLLWTRDGREVSCMLCICQT